MAKARQFSDAATLISELASDDSNLGDAYITLCVHAGIAAADVICCSRLGVHASGQDHAAAAALLDQADAGLGKELRRLLGLKTRLAIPRLRQAPPTRRSPDGPQPGL
nr:hypothetical protein [Candidatus Microthrix sp.]